jgi:hypothetical protein
MLSISPLEIRSYMLQQLKEKLEQFGSKRVSGLRLRVGTERTWSERRVLDWWLDFLDTYTARDYTSQITITHKPVFSVTLFGNGFQRRTFLCFRTHVLATIPRKPHKLAAVIALKYSCINTFIMISPWYLRGILITVYSYIAHGRSDVFMARCLGPRIPLPSFSLISNISVVRGR